LPLPKKNNSDYDYANYEQQQEYQIDEKRNDKAAIRLISKNRDNKQNAKDNADNVQVQDVND